MLELVTATGTADNQNLCWAYDSFGNRLQQASSNVAFIWTPENCTTAGTLYQNVWASFDDYNHISQTNASGSLVMNTPQTPVYDGGGNVINDGSNQYLYDSENRICAVSSYAGMTGYIYDAEGNRTAKGTLSSWSCPTATNFTLATAYVVGASGEQLTEIGAAGDWHHTNVWAGGKLIATYNTGGLHFHIDDPLGTRRAQTNRDGQLEATYQSLPYGDGYSATYAQNVVDDPTENHFTAKERDTESGNDYMFARYYNSATGRFLSPDWSVKVAPVPYAKLDDPQSLNLYSYVRNNPLSRTDPDGHCQRAPGGGNDDTACSKNLTTKQVTNIVYNETQSVHGDGISDARKDVAHAIINGDNAKGDKRPATASDKVDSANQNTQTYSDTKADVQCACQDAAKGTDPTNGAQNFNLRKNDSTKPFQGAPIQTQSGPFTNSYPTTDLPATGIYVNTYRQPADAPKPMTATPSPPQPVTQP